MRKFYLYLLLAALPVVVAVCWVVGKEQPSAEEDMRPVRSSVRIGVAKRHGNDGMKFRRPLARRQKSETSVRDERHTRPTIELDDDAVAGLTELQKEIVRELQQSLDDGLISGVRKAIGRMRELGMAEARKVGSTDWTRFTPRGMRESAVEALGWFGDAAIMDMLDYVADPDPEVMQAAIAKFEAAMEDSNMGDRERAEIIKQLGSVITDEDMIDWMYMEIQDSRHSVGIDTIIHLSKKGTDIVKEKAAENMEFFTGDDEVRTEEDAKRWLAENPDDPDDEEFYGPQKD